MPPVTPSSTAERGLTEASIKRNPSNFKEIEAKRPEWDGDTKFRLTKCPDPDWTFGNGESKKSQGSDKCMVEIDPHECGRTCTNLAPFSYSQLVNHDPPIFVIGFSCGLHNAKDSLKNLVESKECVINMVSEHFVEAANATCINAAYGESEWPISGLTPVPCSTVKADRVGEAVFSIEGKLLSTQEFPSKAFPGQVGGTLAIIEGTRFWVREDALNEEQSLIDFSVSGFSRGCLWGPNPLHILMQNRSSLPSVDLEETCMGGQRQPLRYCDPIEYDSVIGEKSVNSAANQAMDNF
ncbi:hypothetical protein LTR96_009973 [Exophiala xenobiotica]|nr:hypothetical protein LTR72_008893 [Exophiala xenobiotica]KAK5264806.1 hypothetical protein LTR96_009973 [Exophiala xenobiotica]KAK5289943.1 hypothetical protein LTR14_006959 [Exophiala xenobiotica]KAK5337080.1 hypothetical protein LTR98_007387 [Exophiala xenobiotica]KAK5444948.1 hypothetical protein LTR18_004653 [Exophiala xenobiotica]